MNAVLDEYERQSARTVDFHKNVSDLLEGVEGGLSQLVDKMQSGEKGNEDLSFTLVVNIHSFLFLLFSLFSFFDFI